jgi:hypothetical protein
VPTQGWNLPKVTSDIVPTRSQQKKQYEKDYSQVENPEILTSLSI